MREMGLWVFGAALAFVVTAGAFLLLANLATVPSDKNLNPGSSTGGSKPRLELSLDTEQLASLRALPDQSFDLVLKNEGGKQLSDVDVTLVVFPENGAPPASRYYRHEVAKLPAGKSATVRFEVDLSSPGPPFPRPLATLQEPSRRILEIRATTPGGVSAVKTAILPL